MNPNHESIASLNMYYLVSITRSSISIYYESIESIIIMEILISSLIHAYYIECYSLPSMKNSIIDLLINKD